MVEKYIWCFCVCMGVCVAALSERRKGGATIALQERRLRYISVCVCACPRMQLTGGYGVYKPSMCSFTCLQTSGHTSVHCVPQNGHQMKVGLAH